MTIQQMNWVYEQQTLRNSGTKFVLFVLADFADEAGSCYPSIAAIAERTSMSDSTVRDHVKWLCENGWLTHKRLRYTDGSLAQYRFYLVLPETLAPKSGGRAKTLAPEKPDPTAGNRRTIIPNDPPDTLSLKRVRECAGDALASDAVCPGIAILHPLKALLTGDNPCTVDEVEAAVTAAAAWHRGKGGPGSMRNWDVARKIAVQLRDERIAGLPPVNAVTAGERNDQPARPNRQSANLDRAFAAAQIVAADRARR